MPFSIRPFTLRLLTAAACACALVPACKKAEPTIPQCGFAQWSDLLLVDNTAGATLVGQCMARAPSLNDQNDASCIVLEGRKSATCDCASPGLATVPQAHAGAVDDAKQREGAQDFDCYCEVTQLGGDAAHACRFSEDEKPTLNGAPIDGYCYVDPALKLGDPKLVQSCPDTDKHLVRFVGDVAKHDGQGLFVYCGATLCGDENSGGS